MWILTIPSLKVIFLLGKIVILKNIVFVMHEIIILFKIIFVGLGGIKIVFYMHIINIINCILILIRSGINYEGGCCGT